MDEGQHSHARGGKGLDLKRLFFFMTIIIVTSWLVYNVNVNTLEHARNFTRALHWHVLNHQIIGVYWFGQEMLNYPTHQFYQLPVFKEFLINLQTQFGHLEDLSYGLLDQTALNATTQHIDVQFRNGTACTYNWTLQAGPEPLLPFNISDVQQLKRVFIDAHWVDFRFQPIDLGDGNIWNINFHMEPFSDTSIFVQLFMKQQVSLAREHVLSMVLGVILALMLARDYLVKGVKFSESFLQYFLCLFLMLTSIFAISENFHFQYVYMLDGLTCLSAWLCILKFYTNHDDYRLSFLLARSYGMIGRLFASFGPLLIAFSIFGYCVFSRYSGQFSSFWRTFTSLFYICYYNMTYESAIVTSRSNPISMIFFIIFVLLFTICIYSSMLVSVFCSYVWAKREEQIKKDIVEHLKIQCASCQHKYKYADRARVKPKVSFNLSEFLEIDWRNPDECVKYKRVMAARINRLREQADSYLEEISATIRTNPLPQEVTHSLIEDFWAKKRQLDNLTGSEQ